MGEGKYGSQHLEAERSKLFSHTPYFHTVATDHLWPDGLLTALIAPLFPRIEGGFLIWDVRPVDRARFLHQLAFALQALVVCESATASPPQTVVPES